MRSGGRLNAADPGSQIVHADAAGIDADKGSHFVAVPAGRDAQPVQEFGSWTAELHRGGGTGEFGGRGKGDTLFGCAGSSPPGDQFR